MASAKPEGMSLMDFIVYGAKGPPPADPDSDSDDELEEVSAAAGTGTITLHAPIAMPIARRVCSATCSVTGKKCAVVYADDCDGPWTVQGRIGHNVYDLQNADGKSGLYVLKYIDDASERSIKMEVINQIKAAERSIAPNVKALVVHSDSHDNMTASIIMDKMEITLKDYLLKYSGPKYPVLPPKFKAAMKTALSLARQVDKIDIYHNDIRLDNIMKKGGEWYLIDYGMAIDRVDGDPGSEYDTLFNSFKVFIDKLPNLPPKTHERLMKIFDDNFHNMYGYNYDDMY
jgi:hypothetical protein